MLDELLNHLRYRASELANVPILQPADPFLETAGEDLRRRIFITETVDGVTQCLRPEFTIPICLQHGKKPARYAYGGTVFRQSRESAVEFKQVGLEDLGRTDASAADADCIADMLDALAQAGLKTPKITMGDQALFDAVVRAFNLPKAIANRLLRNFGAPELIEAVIVQLAGRAEPEVDDSRARKLAERGDAGGLVTHVEKLMETAQLSPKAGRSPHDIAIRMIAKIEEAHFELDSKRVSILREFLNLRAPLPEMPAILDVFAAHSGIAFGAARSAFEARLDALRARDVDASAITFEASFGRKLDYYTGLLFEVSQNGVAVGGGGRYDRLCSLLGRDKPVPAVGFSISMDRVEECL